MADFEIKNGVAVIPEGTTTIGEDAFRGCSSLQSIVVAKGNSVYDSREGCNAIIETATNTLIVGCLQLSPRV